MSLYQGLHPPFLHTSLDQTGQWEVKVWKQDMFSTTYLIYGIIFIIKTSLKLVVEWITLSVSTLLLWQIVLGNYTNSYSHPVYICFLYL